MDEEKRIASMERSASNQCAHTLHNFPHPTCIERRCCAKSLRILNVFFGFLCSHATKLLTACMYRMRALSETSQHFLCIFRISDVMSCAMHFPTHTPEVYNTRVTQYVYHTMLYSNFWYDVVFLNIYIFRHPIYTTKGSQNVQRTRRRYIRNSNICVEHVVFLYIYIFRHPI